MDRDPFPPHRHTASPGKDKSPLQQRPGSAVNVVWPQLTAYYIRPVGDGREVAADSMSNRGVVGSVDM